MTLTIVHDTDSEQEAIYIGGVLRAEFDESGFDSAGLFECYEQYLRGKPAKLERLVIGSIQLEIWDDVFGTVQWPDSLEELKEAHEQT